MLTTEWTLRFCFFVASSVNQTFTIENDGELVASHDLVKTVPRGTILQAPLQFHHLINKRTSVINEMSDRSGILTYASEDIAAFTQLLRTLGHPACKNKYRPTFVFVQGLHPLSRAFIEVIAFCNLPFHGFYL